MTERELAVVALGVAAACWWHPAIPWWGVAMAVIAVVCWRHPLTVGVVLMASAAFLADRSFDGLTAPESTEVAGVATVMSDPRLRFGAASMMLRVGGKRYLASVSDSVLDEPGELLTGQRIAITATRRRATGRPEWLASRHIVGRLDIVQAQRIDGGAGWWRVANDIRARIAAGVEHWDRSDRALLTGVVLGDDRDQSAVEVYRFRASGLAHLLAVSGQNLALVVALAAPALRSLTRRPRFLAVLALIAVMVCVTRADPSVVRAAAMGVVAALAATLGRRARAPRVVALATIGCLLVDPMLVHSAGFRLSIGAVVAMVILVPPLSERLAGPKWLTVSMAAALAAHVGTAPQLVGWSGSVPLLSPIANVIAAPVGAALMSWGVVATPLVAETGGGVRWVLDGVSLLLVRCLMAIAEAGSNAHLPRVGTVGVAASVLGVAAVLISSRSVRVGVWMVAAAALCVDVVGGAPTGQLDAGGASACVDRGRASLVLASNATSADALSLIPAGRLREIDEIVVLGGGLRTSAVVADLRQVIEVHQVAAADPATVVGSVALENRQRDGGRPAATSPDIVEVDGNWSATCPATHH